MLRKDIRCFSLALAQISSRYRLATKADSFQWIDRRPVMQYIGWHSSAFGLCSFALSLAFPRSCLQPRSLSLVLSPPPPPVLPLTLAIALVLILTTCTSVSRFPLSCSLCTLTSESHVPLCPWVNTFIPPRTLTRHPRANPIRVYMWCERVCTPCKFVRDMRLPVRRESNAGSQPLQTCSQRQPHTGLSPSTFDCVVTVNFSSAIVSLSVFRAKVTFQRYSVTVTNGNLRKR